jgi:hypothetical protein
MKPLTNKYAALNKWLVIIGTVLLIGLFLTPFAWHATVGKHGIANHDDVRAGAMGRGGQFERALFW